VIFLSEILYKCLKEEEANPEIFEFIYNTLVFLDKSEHAIANFHIWFLFKLTWFLGIYPNNEDAAISNFFDLQKGRFVSHEPPHAQFADKYVTGLFTRLFDADFDSLQKLNYNQSDRKQVLMKLLEYYHIHFDNLGEIRSLTILQEVLR
jgi:DNA repair protein RecO (recombination protein O)